jgi:hypothetical protein
MDEGLVLLNGITLIISEISSSKIVISLDRDDDADIAYPEWPMDNKTMSVYKRGA